MSGYPRVGDLLVSRSYVYVVVRGESGIGEPMACSGFVHRMSRTLVWMTESRVWESWSHRIVR